MRRTALCVGGPPALHGALESAYAAADARLRVVPSPLVGEPLEAFRAEGPAVDFFVWAAHAPSEARFETLATATARDYFEGSIFSLVSMLQACLVGMERRRYGRILALSNVAGRLGDEDILASSSSGAIEGLVRSVARESARKGVTANALQIGDIADWDGVGSTIARRFHEVFFTFREPLRARDLAQAIVELTTSEGGKINGQVIGFDGGSSL